MSFELTTRFVHRHIKLWDRLIDGLSESFGRRAGYRPVAGRQHPRGGWRPRRGEHFGGAARPGGGANH